MWKGDTRAVILAPALAVAWLLATPSVATGVELKKKSLETFERYVRLTEERIEREVREENPFLWVDSLPEARRAAAHAQLRQGQVLIERLETREGGNQIKDSDSMIHHWVGVVFVPGATLEQTMKLVTDYNNHQNVYKPEVMRSKLLQHKGDDYKIYLRFFKKKVITAVLNTEHDVHYFHISPTRAHSRSYTTRIAEVENTDQPDEREKPVGNDRGFLWRLYSYWRFEERDAGTYVQCESISLSRDVPRGLGWLIGPFVKGVPKESLMFTLSTTRAALSDNPATPAPR